jgi:hypothetical protein
MNHPMYKFEQSLSSGGSERCRQKSQGDFLERETWVCFSLEKTVALLRYCHHLLPSDIEGTPPKKKFEGYN